MFTRLMLVGAFVCTLGSVGCSGGTRVTTGTPVESAPSEPAAMSLAPGWTIESLITPDDIGSITGKKMTYFPEASSAAQDGKPAAGYTNDGKLNTKLFISVDVAGGQEAFDSAKQFADAATVKDVSGLGDQAIAAAFPGGKVGLIVRRGDAVIRIDWPSAVYGSDAEGQGARLASLLMEKMYK